MTDNDLMDKSSSEQLANAALYFMNTNDEYKNSSYNKKALFAEIMNKMINYQTLCASSYTNLFIEIGNDLSIYNVEISSSEYYCDFTAEKFALSVFISNNEFT